MYRGYTDMFYEKTNFQNIRYPGRCVFSPHSTSQYREYPGMSLCLMEAAETVNRRTCGLKTRVTLIYGIYMSNCPPILIGSYLWPIGGQTHR